MEAELQNDSHTEAVDLDTQAEVDANEAGEPIDVEFPEPLTLGELITALQNARQVAGPDAKVSMKKSYATWDLVKVEMEGHTEHLCVRCPAKHYSPYEIVILGA